MRSGTAQARASAQTARTDHAADSFVQSQATIAAVINMVVNPAVAWLANRDRADTTLRSFSIDATITCVVMCLAIAWFMRSAGERREQTGGLAARERVAGQRFLSHLPRSWWALGLALGVGFALVLVAVAGAAFTGLGISEIPFWGVMVLKVMYPGAIAFVATRLVILRRMEVSR